MRAHQQDDMFAKQVKGLSGWKPLRKWNGSQAEVEVEDSPCAQGAACLSGKQNGPGEPPPGKGPSAPRPSSSSFHTRASFRPHKTPQHGHVGPGAWRAITGAITEAS